MYEKYIDEIKHIIGLKIVDIKEFNKGSFDNGIAIILENGEVIKGQDGEYGDNSLYLDTKI